MSVRGWQRLFRRWVVGVLKIIKNVYNIALDCYGVKLFAARENI
jgi:hypothetical protein